MPPARRRVGLLGGSFDPPHEGHLWMARRAYEEADLAEIWFLPALSPPHKDRRDLSSYEDRLTMTQLLSGAEPYLDVCRIEESLPLPGYSIRSIRALKERYPEVEFTFIIGGDSFASLGTWKESDAIFRETEVLVLAREGFESESDRPCRILRGELHPAQSRLIRKEIAEKGHSEMLTATVANYIREVGLYREREKP
jgi:nicotinate-nucleotide adenylyltransferase